MGTTESAEQHRYHALVEQTLINEVARRSHYALKWQIKSGPMYLGLSLSYCGGIYGALRWQYTASLDGPGVVTAIQALVFEACIWKPSSYSSYIPSRKTVDGPQRGDWSLLKRPLGLLIGFKSRGHPIPMFSGRWPSMARYYGFLWEIRSAVPYEQVPDKQLMVCIPEELTTPDDYINIVLLLRHDANLRALLWSLYIEEYMVLRALELPGDMTTTLVITYILVQLLVR